MSIWAAAWDTGYQLDQTVYNHLSMCISTIIVKAREQKDKWYLALWELPSEKRLGVPFTFHSLRANER